MNDDLETLLPIRTTGSRPPLYCVHPVSGSAYVYAPLADLLPAEQPIYGIEAPGFDDGRDALTAIDAFSAEYVSLLRQFQPDDPYYLLGYSMGGAVAFDMARRLVAAGTDVPLVILLDTAVSRRMELPSEKDILSRFVKDMLWVSGSLPFGIDAVFERAAHDASPASVLREVERAGVFPAEMDAEFLQARYDVFKAHIRAVFGHEVQGVYEGPVVLVKAAEGPAGTEWPEVAPNVEVHTIPGDHYTIWTGRGLEEMGQIIRRSLDATQPAATSRSGASV